MADYIVSPDGSAVYRLIAEGTVAANTFNASLLPAGYTATYASDGTFATTSYNAGFQNGGGGVQIEALYSSGLTLTAGQSLQWVQVIVTNDQPGLTNVPFLDRMNNSQPFYDWPNRDPSLPANQNNFYDFSRRSPSHLTSVGDPITWTATLYPVIFDSATKSLTVENGISWGWTEKSATVGSVTGVFINPVPSDAIVTGVGTSSFTWGDGQPSSLSFAGKSFKAQVNTPFDIGTLSYFNGTSYNGFATAVTLSISFSLTNVPEKNFTLSIPISIVNTPNTDDPVASADIVTLGSTGVSFNVEEGSSSSADIFATISTGLAGSVSGASINGSYSPTDTLGSSPNYSATVVGVEDVTAGGFATTLAMAASSELGVAQNSTYTDTTTPTFVGSTAAGATVTLYDTDGVTVLGTAVAGSDGTYSITSSALSQGSHLLSVKVVDTSGNSLPSSAQLSVTVDTSPQTLDLTVAEALAATATPFHTIDVVDTAANIAALTAAQIATLAAANVVVLKTTDASINFSAAQSAAIIAAGITVEAAANDHARENFAPGGEVTGIDYFFDSQDRLYKTATYYADGSIDDLFNNSAGTFRGLAYDSYDSRFASAGGAATLTFFDATQASIASETLGTDGSFSILIGGNLIRQKTVNADGTYDLLHPGAAGTVRGTAFSSFAAIYATHSNVYKGAIYYDANNNVVAFRTINADGTTELGFSDIQGQSYTAFQNDFSATGAPLLHSTDAAGGGGQVNVLGSGLTINASTGEAGPSASPGDFTFNPHNGEIYSIFAGAANDRLIFASGFGAASIKGLAAAGSASDVVDVSSLFANFAAAAAAATASGGDTVITDAANDKLTLAGIAPSALNAQRLGFA